MFKNSLDRFLAVLFASTILVCLIFYVKGYDTTIGWHVTTSALEESHETLPFSKGPFSFSFLVDKYELVESFSAGPIIRDWATENGLWILWGVGFSLLLAAISLLPRLWMFACMGLILFFLINLRLHELSIFGISPNSGFLH